MGSMWCYLCVVLLYFVVMLVLIDLVEFRVYCCVVFSGLWIGMLW